MEEPGKIITKITNKVVDFRDLNDRMDKDYRRWKMSESPFDSTARIGELLTQERPQDVEVITNYERAFAEKVQSAMITSDMQITVRMAETEGKDRREEVGKFERLFPFAFEKADERLRRMLLKPLKEQIIWHSTVRGWSAVRILVYKDKGKNVIYDFMPLDPRWLTYAVGSRGLIWVSYKTFRSKEDLKDTYDYDATRNISNPVYDYWECDKKGKISYAILSGTTTGKTAFLQEPRKVNVPSMPILISPVSIRPNITSVDGNEIEGYGESIFAPNRKITKTLNKLATIWATHTNILSKEPIVNYSDDEGTEIKDTMHYPGGVVNLRLGHNKLEGIPTKDISPTLVNFVGWLDAQRQHGSLPDIEFGELKDPLSGTAMNELKEARGKVYDPQIRNLNNLYSDMCRLIEEQLIAGDLKVDVETMWKDKYYSTKVTPVDLKEPHIIKVEFTARTPWTQLDTYQIADMAKRLGIPDGFILEHILKLPDPKGLGDLSAVEMYEHSPKGAMLRAFASLMKQERYDEAMQVARDLSNIEMQEQMAMGGGAEETGGGLPPAPPGVE